MEDRDNQAYPFTTFELRDESGFADCASHGERCSKTWPRSRQSIQPPQAGQRTKRSASS